MLKSIVVRRLCYRSGSAAFLLVLWTAIVALATSLSFFTAAYDGATVRVEWEVTTESEVTGFELSRRAATETSYTLVSSVVATGQRRYQYLDSNVYRPAAGSSAPSGPAPGSGPFTYRLTVRSASGDQSYLTVLAGTPSAVQRSWGTIKSMFR